MCEFTKNKCLRQQSMSSEGLTLVVAENTAGYFGVHLTKPGQPKPYQAKVWHDDKQVYLGSFATAEEAALCVARSPVGQVAAGRAASAERQGTLPAVPSGASLKEEGAVPPMPPDAFIKVEVVVTHYVKEEEGSDSRPKRQRAERK